LSPKGARYNDIELVLDEGIRDELMANGVDELLARHVAHLFIRDSLVLFKEKIEHVEAKSANGLIGHNHNELDDDTDFFENIQSTNWQTMRFKPPPLKNNSERQIGRGLSTSLLLHPISRFTDLPVA
jgi:glutamate--cysteine ligase catalytic subunit